MNQISLMYMLLSTTHQTMDQITTQSNIHLHNCSFAEIGNENENENGTYSTDEYQVIHQIHIHTSYLTYMLSYITNTYICTCTCTCTCICTYPISSTAKAGKLITPKREAAVSFELDSRGKRASKISLFRLISSIVT